MSCCNNNNVNRYAGSGGGGSMTMRKKYASKFSKVSGGQSFSLNNGNSNSNTHISNPNNAIGYLGCNTYDSGGKTSVKNYSGFMKTRIVNNNLKCNSVNSFDCYKTANAELVKSYADGTQLNKHLTANNNDQSTRVALLKSKCGPNRENYLQEISGNIGTNNCTDVKIQNATSGSRTLFLMGTCNVTKDNNYVNGFTPGYDIYYNDTTLFKKKCTLKLNNPPDAKTIAC